MFNIWQGVLKLTLHMFQIFSEIYNKFTADLITVNFNKREISLLFFLRKNRFRVQQKLITETIGVIFMRMGIYNVLTYGLW